MKARCTGCGFCRRAQPLERDDLLLGRERRQRRDAGAHRLAVDMHRAGAALREPAAEARPVQREIVAQRIEQRHVGIVDVDRDRLPLTVSDLEMAIRISRKANPQHRDLSAREGGLCARCAMDRGGKTACRESVRQDEGAAQTGFALRRAAVRSLNSAAFTEPAALASALDRAQSAGRTALRA